MTTTQTIIHQLGGNKIFAMAFDLATADEAKNTLYLRIASSLKRSMEKIAGKKPTHVRVTLDPSDTYTVEVLAWGKYENTGATLFSCSFIYADQLVDIVEKVTGLRLAL